MKMARYILALLAVIMLAGCSDNEEMQTQKPVNTEKSYYELLAEYDGNLYDMCEAGGSVFCVKDDGENAVLVKLNGDNAEEEISHLAISDDEWIYENDSWIVFYSDNYSLMKYNIAENKLEQIALKDSMHNILLLDNSIYYLNDSGLLCELRLTDDSARMIDQSVPADSANGIDDIFADICNKRNIYYWNSDGVTLMKYNMDDGLRYIMYKKSDVDNVYTDWCAGEDVIYASNENGFKIIRENEVIIAENNNPGFVVDERNNACYKKGNELVVLKQGNEIERKPVPEGNSCTGGFFVGNTLWYKDAGRVYTVMSDNTVSKSVEFDGEIMDSSEKKLYAFGKPSAADKNGIYVINLAIN